MTEQTEAPSAPLRVRPYMVTRGRTKAEVELEIETMVHSCGDPSRSADRGLISEARAMLRLCAVPQSIAEISAHMHLPLQVVKIVAADLVIARRLATHTGGARSDGRPDLALLERVLDGLQSL